MLERCHDPIDWRRLDRHHPYSFRVVPDTTFTAHLRGNSRHSNAAAMPLPAPATRVGPLPRPARAPLTTSGISITFTSDARSRRGREFTKPGVRVEPTR